MNISKVKWSHDRVGYIQKTLAEAIKIQSQHGNWDYDPYNHGFLNGLIYGQSIASGIEPLYFDPPKRWGINKGIDIKMDSAPIWYQEVPLEVFNPIIGKIKFFWLGY